MTVSQLLANLDASELLEWQAFFILEQEDTKEVPSGDVVDENIKVELERAQGAKKR